MSLRPIRAARRSSFPGPPALLAALCALALPCCADDPADATPVETLTRFLDLMDRSRTNAGALQPAYRLIDKNSRKTLQERANEAATLTGREFGPWEMLAQGRFRLRFAPAKRGGMKTEMFGEQAAVLVRGDQPGQQARVPMVREPDGWKVELRLPAVQRIPDVTPAPGTGTAPRTEPAAAPSANPTPSGASTTPTGATEAAP